jgi:tetratricopeptide (TPR) repeat protein
MSKYEILDDISNSVAELCRQNKFDEADLVCKKLREEYPDMVDGLDRQAMVYEKRGDNEKALEYYTKTLEFMKKEPNAFDYDWVEDKITELKRKLSISA